MLAVVVDDHDMGVTHVIRGDDHLINAGRQSLIYTAMGWDIPEFAHIPLIHGEDGKKLSKRHGATGVHEYAALGYMPAAMRNYLARLGWSHGNDELFTTAQAIEWFDFDGMGKSPSRLDFKKLDHVSAFHIKEAPIDQLACDVAHYATETGNTLNSDQRAMLPAAANICREKSKKLDAVWEKAQFAFLKRPIQLDERSAEQLNSVSYGILKELTPLLANVSWSADKIENLCREFASQKDIGLGKIGMPLKAALSGRSNAPSAFGMMDVLGKDESMARINDVIRDQ